MPPMILLFGLAYADKAVLGSAAVAGILEALQLSVTTINSNGKQVTDLTRYSTATALFYAGYAVSVLPAALVATRVPNIIHFLSAMIILWGVVTILTPTIHHWQVLCAQRFFLGMIEATVSPGFVVITRAWYKRREHASRLGIWYSSTGLFSIFAGVFNYAIASIRGSIAPWKLLYLVAGAFTIVFGLLFLLLVPKDPSSPPIFCIRAYNIFTPRQRIEFQNRLGEDDLGLLSNSSADSNWTEVKECFLDMKMYMFALIAFSIYLTNGAVTAFGTQILRNLHYTGAQAIALQAPGGFTTALSIYITGYISLKVPNSRIILLCLSCLPVMAGALMIWLGNWKDRGVIFAGLWMLPIFGASFVQLLSLATANVKGNIKPSIAAGIIFVAYSLSNVSAPYTFKGSELAQKYRTTWQVIIGAMCASIFFSVLLGLNMAYANKRKAQVEADGDGGVVNATDMKDPTFRYVF
ncbi:MFS general substrate transporter [Tilletiaria anomala UBC 951]|uniref:MFS general substrate transporter n=1 Tax=Tilletiaria anomala (strain ATCC 24038 / CBS 436.72 / UBC 951) TaxID=1037660 RepID=A0A066WL90_TILAU|nr:MFS general substrate transporter [Tilletiaria anomala UBC 951]KDN53328.1 MFS general substrate transporter [Tilletiaria anomala UBC 951]